MNNSVSVDDAIKKGKRLVNYPGTTIMLGTLGICFYLGIQHIMPFWIVPLGFILSFVFAWIYWSFMITKWRLWAFDNVRNVHELKKRAIHEKLIWPDDSFFEKTEIRSMADKEKWNTLQYKFSKKDMFIDDFTIPNETIIYFSKSKNFTEMAICICCFIVGICLIIGNNNYLLGIIMCAIGGYLGFKKFKNATNAEPQILINEKGIKTASTDFYEWKDVKYEEVIGTGSGKHTSYFLKYNYPNGSVDLKIDNLDTNYDKLNKLLILYRGRNTKRSKHHSNSMNLKANGN